MSEDDEGRSYEERELWRHRYRVAVRAGLSDPDAQLFADAEVDSHETHRSHRARLRASGRAQDRDLA